MKYRKKPVVIEAFLYKGIDSIMHSSPEWVQEAWDKGVIWQMWDHDNENGPICLLYIKTLEGRHLCNYGDYIICGVKGEIYPCKPDIFALTYELAEMEAEPVKEDIEPERFCWVYQDEYDEYVSECEIDVTDTDWNFCPECGGRLKIKE